MSWQDWVIGVVQFVFMLALIPSLRGPDKPEYWTSILTGVCMAVLAFVYATQAWVLSTIVCLCLMYLWFVLAVQVWRRDKHGSLFKYAEKRPRDTYDADKFPWPWSKW